MSKHEHGSHHGSHHASHDTHAAPTTAPKPTELVALPVNTSVLLDITPRWWLAADTFTVPGEDIAAVASALASSTNPVIRRAAEFRIGIAGVLLLVPMPTNASNDIRRWQEVVLQAKVELDALDADHPRRQAVTRTRDRARQFAAAEVAAIAKARTEFLERLVAWLPDVPRAELEAFVTTVEKLPLLPQQKAGIIGWTPTVPEDRAQSVGEFRNLQEACDNIANDRPSVLDEHLGRTVYPVAPTVSAEATNGTASAKTTADA